MNVRHISLPYSSSSISFGSALPNVADFLKFFDASEEYQSKFSDASEEYQSIYVLNFFSLLHYYACQLWPLLPLSLMSCSVTFSLLFSFTASLPVLRCDAFFSASSFSCFSARASDFNTLRISVIWELFMLTFSVPISCNTCTVKKVCIKQMKHL